MLFEFLLEIQPQSSYPSVSVFEDLINSFPQIEHLHKYILLQGVLFGVRFFIRVQFFGV